MDPEQAWEDLAAAALLGTERRAFARPSVGGALGLLLGGLAGREPEGALLGTAAMLAAYRRAGRLPTPDPGPPVEPAEVDGRPRCSVASDGHLGLMLSGTHAEVLEEWLVGLASAGKRPAEEAVPDLLDAGRARVELRPAVAAAVGPLGAWLARQNGDWAYAAAADAPATGEGDAAPEDLWQTGTTLQRAALLRRAREADPPKGRELVASTWDADGTDARAAFVGEFAAGLGRDDEPLLERALDDRRKEVRSAAAAVLARLPGSAYVGRMAARVAPLLGFAEPATRAILGGLRGEPVVGDTPGPPPAPFAEVGLPEACDKAMARDGIEPKPGRSGLGEKAWWLSELVARVPPSAWSGAWGLPPATLAEAAVRSKWNDALYPALVGAATLHRDFEWLDALLPHRRLAGRAFDAGALLGALPVDRREAAALALVRADDGKQRPRDGEGPLTEEQCSLIAGVPGPWGEGLSGLVLGRVAVNLAGKDHIHHPLANLLRAAARSLPPAAALAAPPRRTAEDVQSPSWLFHEVDRALESFHATTQFRHEMIRELRA